MHAKKFKNTVKSVYFLEHFDIILLSHHGTEEMIPSNFFALTDLVIIGTNPEMADYSNPRGEIIGYSAYVYAEDKDGNRRRLHVATSRWEEEVLPRAENQAAALNKRLESGKFPVAFDRWDDARPCYGSNAYIEYGQADDVALEARELEDEQWN